MYNILKNVEKSSVNITRKLKIFGSFFFPSSNRVSTIWLSRWESFKIKKKEIQIPRDFYNKDFNLPFPLIYYFSPPLSPSKNLHIKDWSKNGLTSYIIYNWLTNENAKIFTHNIP